MNLLLVTLVSYVFIAGSVEGKGPGQRLLCSSKFPRFVDCLSKYGHFKLNQTYWECRERSSPNVHDSKFFKFVCIDHGVRRTFGECIHEKQQPEPLPLIPEECTKLYGGRLARLGKRVRQYICSNKARYDCIRSNSPSEKLEVMDKCRQMAFPDVSADEFFGVLCDNSDPSVVESSGEWGLCMKNNTKSTRGVGGPLSFIPECHRVPSSSISKKRIQQAQLEDKGKQVQKFLCGNRARYDCIRQRAPSKELTMLDGCMKKSFPGVSTDEFLDVICTDPDSQTMSRTSQWAACVIENTNEATRKGSLPYYMQECQNAVTPTTTKETPVVLTVRALIVRNFFCGNWSRYECLKHEAPRDVQTILLSCSGLADEELKETLCSSDDDHNQFINKWVDCVRSGVLRTQAGQTSTFLEKCVA
ncbi:uncharacterized protein LOC106469369 [Limulus polyphemus]|uniref:Uncharacterized protein LOC106469369 n=1 Tax=Limulus polyphemus TaxID=6850 RepID=A0ABM1BN31_LIMPO|nr:uncharacterized protein LOC106469369 [Limulus polyphemus]